MGREKSVVVSGSKSNQLTNDVVREVVREQNGVREVTREVIRQFKEISIGKFLDLASSIANAIYNFQTSQESGH